VIYEAGNEKGSETKSAEQTWRPVWGDL